MIFRIRFAVPPARPRLPVPICFRSTAWVPGAMLAACREGAEEAREDRAKLVAITVLTSMNQDALSEIGVESPVAEEAARPAKARSGQRHRRYRVLADGGSRHA